MHGQNTTVTWKHRRDTISHDKSDVKGDRTLEQIKLNSQSLYKSCFDSDIGSIKSAISVHFCISEC